MTESDILISFIVPIYNVEPYLRKCVKSIINQTYKNIEIILVDDGSPDNCPKICDEYASIDSRIVVIHKANGGLVSARKAGISVATGDYICYVDGDDWISPIMAEKFHAAIIDDKPDIVCCGDIEVFPKCNIYKPHPEREGFYQKHDIIADIYPSLIHRADGYYFDCGTPGKCVKACLTKSKYSLVNNSVCMGEDFIYITSVITSANSLYIIKDCFYYYRQQPKSITRSPKPISWEYPKQLLEHFTNDINLDQSDFREQVKRHMSHAIFNCACSQFYQNKPRNRIIEDIKTNIAPYRKWIDNVHFTSLKHKVMAYSLKHNLFLALQFYNKFIR